MEKTLKTFLEESIASRTRMAEMAKNINERLLEANYVGQIKALKIVLESLHEFSQPSEQKQFEGEISNVKVWDRALTPEEIQEECEKDVSKETFDWFHNEQGDITLTHNEQPFAFVKTEKVAKDVIKKFLEYSSSQRQQARNEAIQEVLKLPKKRIAENNWDGVKFKPTNEEYILVKDLEKLLTP